MTTTIIWTIAILTVLGVVLAVVLYFVAEKFKVEEDPRIDARSLPLSPPGQEDPSPHSPPPPHLQNRKGWPSRPPRLSEGLLRVLQTEKQLPRKLVV